MGTRPSRTAFSISGPLNPRDPPAWTLMVISPPVTWLTTLANVFTFSTWKLPSGHARGRSHSVAARAGAVRVRERTAAEATAAAENLAAWSMFRYLFSYSGSMVTWKRGAASPGRQSAGPGSGSGRARPVRPRPSRSPVSRASADSRVRTRVSRPSMRASRPSMRASRPSILASRSRRRPRIMVMMRVAKPTPTARTETMIAIVLSMSVPRGCPAPTGRLTSVPALVSGSNLSEPPVLRQPPPPPRPRPRAERSRQLRRGAGQPVPRPRADGHRYGGGRRAAPRWEGPAAPGTPGS